MHTQRHLFLQHLAPTSDAPMLLDIERAEGIYLYGTDGKQYADLIAGIGVSSYGHGNKKIIEAIKTQTEKHLHLMVYGEYIQKPQVQLAQKLCALLPQNLQSVYYVNSGSEAVEGALKLAKRATGRSQILSAKNAYHGSTQGALSLMDNEFYTAAYRPLLPNVEYIEYNNITSLQKITNQTAAVIIETLQGEAGYIAPTADFLASVREKCNQTGTLLILDEIQCGMGRTGKWFAFEHYGITPDILVLAKAFGAGMPLGAFIASAELMLLLSHSPVLGHITTFGGHPVCCAAALAGIEFLEDEKLIDEVSKKEILFRQLLQHKSIKTITGKGLMLGVEFETELFNKAVITKCIEMGVITDWFLHCGYKMRLAPPLTITVEEIAQVCKTILAAIDNVLKIKN
jgi:acetylornithine/N-succinyldiaminopimelate aminotransferase